MTHKVMIGPGEVAGYFTGLQKGLKKIGVNVSYYPLESDMFEYSDNSGCLKRTYQFFCKVHSIKCFLLIGVLGKIIIRLILLIHAICTCKTFIFNGYRPFLTFHELSILKLLRKKIIVIYLGSDSRPLYLSGRLQDDASAMNEAEKNAYIFKDVIKRQRNIKLVEKYATHIITHSASSQFFERHCIRFTKVGIPLNHDRLENIDKTKKYEKSHTIAVLHAPSRPVAKGSFIVNQLVDKAKANGIDCKLVELKNTSNAQVLEMIAKADFVFDEVYSDTPLGVLGAEAAWLGKPTLVSGYCSETELGNTLQNDIRNPNFVRVDRLETEFRELLNSPRYRAESAKEVYNQVCTKWSEEQVAINFRYIINGEVPRSWYFNPKDVQYLSGWGISNAALADQLASYIDQFGTEALHLSHNDKLRSEILTFSRTKTTDA